MRRDLLLRHDRTVHAKDGGAPLPSEQKRRSNNKAQEPAAPGPSKSASAMALDAPAPALAELERQTGINEDVIRFMTVRIEKTEAGPSAMMRKQERDRERGDRGDRGPRRDGGGDRGPREGGDRDRAPRREREDA